MVLKAYEAEKTMAEIAEVIGQNANRLAQAVQAITVAKSSLDGMAATYGAFISTLEAAATAGPSDVVWAQLKATKDKYVQEFGQLKTYATALEAAADGVAKP